MVQHRTARCLLFRNALRTCHQLWRKTAFHFLVPNIGSYRFFRVHASVYGCCFFRFWGPFMSFRPQHTQWLRGDMWRWNPPENDLHMEKGGGADGPNRVIQKGCMCTTFAKKSWILSGLQLFFPLFPSSFLWDFHVLIRLFGCFSERPPIPLNEISASDFNPSHNWRVKMLIPL